MALPPFVNGFQPFLRNNSDMLLQAGAGLLGGQTAPQQVAGLAQGVAGVRQRNKTLEFLRQQNPELAAAVESGALSGGDAYKLFYQQKLQAQKPRNLSFETLADGTYGNFDETTGDFTPIGKVEKAGGMDDYSNRANAAKNLGLTPDNPAYQGFVLTGKMPREDTQTLTATDKKALWAAEDEIPSLDNTISSLQRARELNRKTFTGVTAGARGFLGTAVPGGDYLVDGEAAKATSEFNKLMSMEAIQAMAQSLKGATTDSELARFVEILADPAADPDIRERTIDRMIELSRRVKEVKSNRINELRGQQGGVPGARAAPGAAGARTSSGIGWSVEP
jgi:hypothetical protein